MKRDPLRRLHPLESLGNAPARAGDVRVERLEQRLRPRVPFPHKHDFFHFLLVERGSGWHEIDFRRYAVKPGRAFLVKPGEVHAWKLGASTRGFVLEFHRASLGAEAGRRWKALPASFDPEDPVKLRQLLTLMQGEFVDKPADSALALERYLDLFGLTLGRGAEAEGRTQVSLVEDFAELVEKHFRREHSVGFYAKALGLKPKALSQRVQKALGRTAGTVVQERCLLEAKRLLVYSDLPVAEIGYELGFSDPNYFARFFRRRTELSPGRFRKLAAHTIR